MPEFGATSEKQLATCHEDLQTVLRDAVQYFDFSVVEGHRNEEDQEAAFARGASQKHWPDGNHNKLPSKAADCMPYPIDWSDKGRERVILMAGFILASARRLGISVRWGGDWNMNDDTRDEGFRDIDHFELH